MSDQVNFDWIDAFSNRAFAGNGCVVVYNAENWSLEDRLSLVRETSLSECTFISTSSVADWRVQYYLTSREIPFAGHPTIASVWSLFERKLIGESAKLETGVGLIDVSVDGNWVTLNAPLPTYGQKFEREEIAALYDLPSDAILNEPELIQAGLGFIMVELADQATLERAKLNFDKLKAFQAKYQLEGALEPYLFTFNHEYQDQAITLGRLLLAPPHPAEDPFTGSATGQLAAYLFKQNRVDANFVHAQGHALGRIGFAQLSLEGEPHSIQSIKISGQAHRLMSGTITL